MEEEKESGKKKYFIITFLVVIIVGTLGSYIFYMGDFKSSFNVEDSYESEEFDLIYLATLIDRNSTNLTEHELDHLDAIILEIEEVRLIDSLPANDPSHIAGYTNGELLAEYASNYELNRQKYLNLIDKIEVKVYEMAATGQWPEDVDPNKIDRWLEANA